MLFELSWALEVSNGTGGVIERTLTRAGKPDHKILKI